MTLPAGPFGTIVADPPWDIRTGPLKGRAGFGDCMTGPSRRLAYPTMTVDEIKALPVAAIAAPDAHLYLWVVNAFVEQAFAVARAWGFAYSTLLTWSKRPMGSGLGGTWGLSSEHVLFCRRGRTGRGRRAVGTVFTWKRPYDHRGKPKHSAKPPQFFDQVATISPGPFAELFARAPRLGWATWGNEPATPGGVTPGGGEG